jgi:hypothetical protein
MLRGLDLECGLRKSGQSRQDLTAGLRPHERFGMRRMGSDESHQLSHDASIGVKMDVNRAAAPEPLANERGLSGFRIEGRKHRGQGV